MRNLLLLALLFSSPIVAYGQAAVPVIQPVDCNFFNAEDASADINSTDAAAFGKAFDLAKMARVSFAFVWSGFSGTLDGQVKVQVSTHPNPSSSSHWVDKSGAVYVIDSASGGQIISVTNLTEKWARIVYTHNNVSAGSLSGWCHAKGA